MAKKPTAKKGNPKAALDRLEKAKTASQLFTEYMKAVERIRSLAMRLDKELADSQHLADELQTRYGVYVSGKQPDAVNRPVTPPASTPIPAPTHVTAPAPTPAQPAQNADVAAAEQEPTPEGEYQPPAQTQTAEAPRLSGKESAAVAEIRANANLSPDQQEDAEALEISSGPGKLAKLQRAMGGVPAVVPSPGPVERTGTPTPGPDNREGGPVTQGPAKE